MLSKEYIGQVKAIGSETVSYQSANKSKEELQKWFDSNMAKGTFKGHELVIKSRMLFREKPFHLSYEQKLLLASGVLILFLVWKLATL